ncbi:hypothetical protein [Sorangium cellulosum]|uniref:PEGA domain-containing protein n=1 Tax=Sorangium cellulosum TaxID=56 RepID=A0A150QVZ4_SORCE|nr:hypothetical protein [Sorangium cellulosum]KYF72189.1 hypothetical protein BE15_28800 [Sorangium cellulosum]
MNVAEKVATLEALLQRVQRNAAAPRTRTLLPVSAELVPHRGEAPGAIADDIAGAAWPDGGLSPAETSPASEARPAAVAAGGPPRAPEPFLDDARHVAASPAAQAPQTAARQPAAAARAPQEAQPAAKTPQQPAAKTPQQPPVKTPAAATPAAGAARTSASRTAAAAPARASAQSLGAPERPAAGRPAASLDLPRADARDAGPIAGGQETYRPPADAEPKPRDAARPAASKVGAPVAARSPGQLSGGAAVPPARGSSPRAEGKPFFPHEDVAARGKPVESDSELSFAGLLPDEPTAAPKPGAALKLPAERRPEPAAAEARRSLADRAEAPVAARAASTPVAKEGAFALEAAAERGAAISEPVTPKAAPAETLAANARRAMGEPAIERELSRDMVDDEPTVIRGMLEDEPTVIRSRPEGLEDEETAVRSARSEAQAIARSVHDQETVDAAPGVLPRGAVDEGDRKSRPKPLDRDLLPKVITKDPPIVPADKAPPKQSEVATTRPPADTSVSVTERPGAPRSRVGLLIAAVALLVAGAAVAHRLGLFGSEPAPPANVGPDTNAGAAQDVTAQPPPTQPTPAATPAETAPAAPSAVETATPTATAEPTATAAPAETAAPAAGSSESLPSNRGHLLVNSPEQASVYVNGSLAGNTGETLEVPCGTRYVRLGKLTTEKTSTPAWLSSGQAVIVGCRKQTVLSINPTPTSPAPERPAKRKASPAATPAPDQEGAAPAPAGGDAPVPAGDPAP